LCGAIFTGGTRLSAKGQPLPTQRASSARVIVKIGVASVLLPAAAFIVGMLLYAVMYAVMPECSCDEGSGCSGCGANDLIEILVFGGFVGALGALVTVLPASLLLSFVVFVVKLLSGRRS
jgi:hypothetical protein